MINMSIQKTGLSLPLVLRAPTNFMSHPMEFSPFLPRIYFAFASNLPRMFGIFHVPEILAINYQNKCISTN